MEMNAMAYPLLECTAVYAADRDGVPVTLSQEAPHGTTDTTDTTDTATTKDHVDATDHDTTAPDHDWDGVNHNDPLDFHNDPDPDPDHDHDHH
jgi:hypothetical protein